MERRLASGLVGPSWLLRNLTTEGPALLRFLSPAHLSTEQFAQNVRSVSTAAADCPGAVEVLDLFVEGHAVWLLRDWLPGENLREALDVLGFLTTDQAVSLVAGVCKGLITHAAGPILHGHLSVENVLIHLNGAIYVSDHGLLPAGARSVHPLTLPYLAPEVAAGSAPTFRSDIYALGALLYTSICGHYPLRFTGDPVQDTRVLRDHHILAPPPGVRLHGDLGSIIWRALQPKPLDRFATAQEMLSALLSLSPQAARPSLLARLLGNRSGA